MSATYNNSNSAGYLTSQGSPCTVATVTVNAGSNQGVLVLIAHTGPYNSIAISGVTFGGAAMALVAGSAGNDSGGNLRNEIWWLGQGQVPTGANKAVVVSWSSGTMSDILGCAIVLDSGDQSASPLETASENNTLTSHVLNIAPASAVGEFVAAIGMVDMSGVGSITTNLGTERANGGTTDSPYIAVATLSGAAGTTPFQFTGSSGSPTGVVSAVAWKAAATSTLTQSHGRFRNDDGSETTATWQAAEDANLTAPTGTLRVRMAVKAAGDPASAAYQLEWQKVSEGVWRKVI